ncbi:hypothetical protein ACLOJK_040938 [Asimina triloba]
MSPDVIENKKIQIVKIHKGENPTNMMTKRIQSSNVSVGHSYNLIDVHSRRIWNVETASKNRISVKDIASKPFFHANMPDHMRRGSPGPR